jgi:hypothetical protein
MIRPVYMDQLIWYDQNLQQGLYQGAAIFLAGSNDKKWNSYDIFDRMPGGWPIC